MIASTLTDIFTVLGSPYFGGVFGIGYILLAVGLWKTFAKAKVAGWLGLIPIVNLLVLSKVAGRSFLWWILALTGCLFFVPFLVMGFGVAERFGRGSTLGWILGLFPPIGYLLLGLSEARYVRPAN